MKPYMPIATSISYSCMLYQREFPTFTWACSILRLNSVEPHTWFTSFEIQGLRNRRVRLSRQVLMFQEIILMMGWQVEWKRLMIASSLRAASFAMMIPPSGSIYERYLMFAERDSAKINMVFTGIFFSFPFISFRVLFNNTFCCYVKKSQSDSYNINYKCIWVNKKQIQIGRTNQLIWIISLWLQFIIMKMMSGCIWIAAILMLLRVSVQDNVKFYGPLSSEIILHGRYYVEGAAIRYDWTCFKIDFCFRNSKKIVWNVVDTWNIYHVVVDSNQTKVVHPQKNQKIEVFESPSLESHCIEIIKITENHYGPIASHKDSTFNGIEVEGGELMKNSKKYDYRFQFLGDSLTTAFGVLSGRNPICFFKMKTIQNCRESWAVHLSNMFNAEYRLQAVSGKGVVRNAQFVFGPKMPSLFSRLSDNSKENSYKIQDEYVPNVLFIFIGANDYNNLNHPSINSFVRGYTEMLNKIVKDYMIYSGEGIKIISICDSQFNAELCLNVKAAVKSFTYAYRMVYYVQVPQGVIGKSQLGCIGHPNVVGQRRIAQSLYANVKKVLGE